MLDLCYIFQICNAMHEYNYENSISQWLPLVNQCITCYKMFLGAGPLPHLDSFNALGCGAPRGLSLTISLGHRIWVMTIWLGHNICMWMTLGLGFCCLSLVGFLVVHFISFNTSSLKGIDQFVQFEISRHVGRPRAGPGPWPGPAAAWYFVFILFLLTST